MDNQTIIKQLKKALEEKENPKMRVRIEVMIDMLEGIPQNKSPQAAPSAPHGAFNQNMIQDAFEIKAAQNGSQAVSQPVPVLPVDNTPSAEQGKAGRKRQIGTSKPPVGLQGVQL